MNVGVGYFEGSNLEINATGLRTGRKRILVPGGFNKFMHYYGQVPVNDPEGTLPAHPVHNLNQSEKRDLLNSKEYPIIGLRMSDEDFSFYFKGGAHDICTEYTFLLRQKPDTIVIETYSDPIHGYMLLQELSTFVKYKIIQPELRPVRYAENSNTFD